MYTKKDAKTHRRIMRWLKSATPEEIGATAVRAGIYNQKGELMPQYGGQVSYCRNKDVYMIANQNEYECLGCKFESKPAILLHDFLPV